MPITKLQKKGEKLDKLLAKPVIPDGVRVENGKFDIRGLSNEDKCQYLYETCEHLLDYIGALTTMMTNLDINFQVLLKHLKVDKRTLVGELFREAEENKKLLQEQKKQELKEQANKEQA